MNGQIIEKPKRSIWFLAGGATTILLGLVFLAENLAQKDLDDLWAIALLPLALAFIAQAHTAYLDEGRLSGKVAGWAVIGVSTAAVTTLLIFGLDAGELWPVFFIITGAGIMLATWR